MNAKSWWIVVAAAVVIIVIIALVTTWARHRRVRSRRSRAQQLRTAARQSEPTVAEARDRATAAAEEAQRARRQADDQAQRAEQLEAEAKFAHDAADAVQRDHAAALRHADRLDPDTPTDRAGNRITGTGTGDNGESTVDPATGKPVEEAARQDDPRADRAEFDGKDGPEGVDSHPSGQAPNDVTDRDPDR